MPSTLADWQSQVDRWILRNGRYWTTLSQLARLTEEVGELARAINHAHGGKPRTAKDAQASMREELGDVLFVLLALANDLGVDLEEALALTLAKADARLTPGGRPPATDSSAVPGRRRSAGTAPRRARRPGPSAPG
jgi:NTP pyrophosphatase (non-canonical NTP hydrolase)